MYVYIESLFPSLIRMFCALVFPKIPGYPFFAVVPGREPRPQSFGQRAVLCI